MSSMASARAPVAENCCCGDANAVHLPHLSCHTCAACRLSSHIARYHAAAERHAQQKEECHRRILATRLRPAGGSAPLSTDTDCAPLSSRRPLPDPSQVRRRAAQLGRRRDALRCESDNAAVRVTAWTLENDEREERLQVVGAKVRDGREGLERLRRCWLLPSNPEQGDGDSGGSVGGGLTDALVTGMQQIRKQRFGLACQVFDMHRLDVGEQYSQRVQATRNDNGNTTTKRHESASGVGKIGGLPLPHAGPVLYGVIPPLVLAASLRQVASLTQLVARCLGVVLPHPILVCFRECPVCGSIHDYGADIVVVTAKDEPEGRHGSTLARMDDLCEVCRQNGGPESLPTTKRSLLTKSLPPSSASSQRRPSLLSLVGSSARKAINMTTSATSRAITHMHHAPSAARGEAVVQTGSRRPLSKSLAQKNTHTNVHIHTHTTEPRASNGGISLMSPERISRRISYASFACLRENDDVSATEYVLNPPRWREEGTGAAADCPEDRGATLTAAYTIREEFRAAEERFATGLQLLQNDVAALCFRAGVDVAVLWPAESVLLNLHSLRCYCQQVAKRGG